MGIIHVAGLGPGAVASIPYGTVQLVEKGLPVYLRTARHPSANFLIQRDLPFVSLDSFYEEANDFSTLYDRIVEFLVAVTDREKEIVYLVPGHPGVAERSVQLLQVAAQNGRVKMVYESGQSFIDDLLFKIGVDPVDGLLLLDATSLRTDMLQPKAHTIMMQLYNQAVASDTKVLLSEVYGDEWEVVIASSIGIAGQELIQKVPLFELDRIKGIDHLTTHPRTPQRVTPLYHWLPLDYTVAS